MTIYTETTDLPNFFHQSVILEDGDQFNGFAGSGDAGVDFDWIPVQLSKNYSYMFDLKNSFWSPSVTVFDSSGNKISSFESSVSGDTMVWATPDSDGLYYVEVHGSSFANVKDYSSYELTVTSEIANNASTLSEINFDYSNETIATFTDKVEYHFDHDWLKVELDKGYTYLFDSVSNAPYGIRIYLRDANGDFIEYDNYVYSQDPLPYTVAESGTYYLVMDSDLSTGTRPIPLTPEGTYQVTVKVEPTGNANTNYSIDVGETVSETWSSHQDYDWYKVDLEAGVSYFANTESGNLTYLWFAKANGDRVEATTLQQSGGDFEAVTVQTSGTYYLVAKPYSGDYQVSLKTEVAGDSSTNSSISIGQTVNSSMDFYRDKDAFEVDLIAGQTYNLSANLDDISPRSIALSVYDADGNRLGYNSDKDLVEYEITVQNTGKAYIYVEDSGSGTPFGSYDLSISLKGTTENGTNNNDVFVGDINQNLFYAEGGNDLITGAGGNDTIDGGDGVDTAKFSGNLSDYTISKSGTTYTLMDNRDGSPDGTDTLTNIEKLQFLDQVIEIDANTGSSASSVALKSLFDNNADAAKGLTAAYGILFDGVPNQAGYTFLINGAVSTNFGAGAGVTFNTENIFINLVNNLVQGNAAAKTKFDTIASGSTLLEKVTSLYNQLVPTDTQTTEGLAFITRPDGLAFYESVAVERGVAGTDGAAIVAMASLLKIAVDGDFGIGNSVNDLFKAASNLSSIIPTLSENFTPLETADGTAFDGDDKTTNTTGTSDGSSGSTSLRFARETEIETYVSNDNIDISADTVEIIGITTVEEFAM